MARYLASDSRAIAKESYIQKLRPILDITRELGISEDKVSQYGKWKAKIAFKSIGLSRRRTGKLILISAMTPTPFGEGKTVTSIGLAMALSKLGRSSIVCLRQPSLGPVFGIKGGAAGGGKSTVEPLVEINLGLNGDIYAVGSAHNLLSAMLDNHLFQGNDLGIDLASITWPRAVDMNDRALRKITIGLSGKNPRARNDRFVITAASEVMAILGLSREYSDLKERLGQIIIGRNSRGVPVNASQLRASGAMAAILRDALEPNIVQTAEGTPALVHGGPFGNIAHGTSSIVSIKLGLVLSEYCIVESGFATDLGAEKFVDIVTRIGGFDVDAAVVVATVRALKHHGGISQDRIVFPDVSGVTRGLENLGKHIENIRALGLDPVVALNKFRSDSQEEITCVGEFCKSEGVQFSISDAFEKGGDGAIDLAERVIEAAEKNSRSTPIYSLEAPIEKKLEAIVKTIYGGKQVQYLSGAKEDIHGISSLGLERNPICVAKTQLSLSDDPHKIGRPSGFEIRIRKVTPAAGSGLNIVYAGEIETMPGLPRHPNAENIDLTEEGEIVGVF